MKTFLFPVFDDRQFQLRHRTFTHYLLFRIIFGFAFIFLAFKYPVHRANMLAGVGTTLLPGLFLLWLMQRRFELAAWLQVGQNFLFISFYIIGTPSQHPIIGQLLTNCVMTCLFTIFVVNWRAGQLQIIWFVTLFFIDYWLEATGRQLPRPDFQALQVIDYLAILCAYALLTVLLVGYHIRWLVHTFQQYREENIRRRRVEGGLRENNRQMAELNTQLEESVDALRESHERLERYAHMNSHQVRGPLARVLGMARLVEMANTPEEQKMFLFKLKESAEELDGIIHRVNKVLDVGDGGGE